MEARGVPGGEELLRIGSTAGTTHLLRDADIEVEDAVGGLDVTVAGVALCFPLYAASRAVTRLYGELLAELGLTYPQYLVLLALWEREEPLAIGDLGLALKLDSGTSARW